MPKFRKGDLVWAKMKGFPPWPGNIVDAPAEIKKPSQANKKPFHCVYFYGSENYAWMQEECIKNYSEFRDKFIQAIKPAQLKDAIEKSETVFGDYLVYKKKKEADEETNARDALPSIKDELDAIYSSRHVTNMKMKKENGTSSFLSSASSLLGGGETSPQNTNEYKKKLIDGSGNQSKKFKILARSRLSPPPIDGPSSLSDQSEETSDDDITQTLDQSRDSNCEYDSEHDSRIDITNDVTNNADKLNDIDGTEGDLLEPKGLKGVDENFNPESGTYNETQKSDDKHKKGKINEKVPHEVKINGKGSSGLGGSSRKKRVALVNTGDTKRTNMAHSDKKRSFYRKFKNDPFNTSLDRTTKNIEIKLIDISRLTGGDLIKTEACSSTSLAAASSPSNELQDIQSRSLKLGFLGTGIMGKQIVHTLLNAGHQVCVWNRDPAKCKELIKSGATYGITPGDVITSCNIVFCCFSEHNALRKIVLNDDDVIKALKSGKGIVNLSTNTYKTASDLAEVIGSLNSSYLEAPLFGSTSGSNSSLLILTAGDENLYRQCEPLFKLIGRPLFFGRDESYAAKMALIVKSFQGAVIAGLAETLSLAEKTGIRAEEVISVLSRSMLDCPIIRNKGQEIIEGLFLPSLPLKHQQNDLKLTLDMADGLDHPTPLLSTANELYKRAKNLGCGMSDVSSIHKAFYL
ncbi:cytokine-like nuclear factor N-PAC isoform X2 [Gordionus sp. m RMFG-2023]|uniref:cytokine-like nuclear factor N-PAC isoform X2 n=1 Tax=Gordionus sp. m RMFG-2023 TaxID=3053472 RepID=UPI0031FC0D39